MQIKRIIAAVVALNVMGMSSFGFVPLQMKESTSIVSAATTFAIKKQPSNQIKQSGSKAHFTIEATGDNVSYQWQYSTNGGTTWLNSPIASAKTSELVIDVTEKKNGFMFRCIVSDGKESITSDTCKLIVSNLAITTQPSNQTVKAGDKTHFTIEATGDNVSYQWQYSTNGGTTWLNSPIASAKTSELVIDVTEKKNGFMFRCIVSDGKESITSDTCKLIVSNLAITTQPSNQTVKVGGKAHFTIEATGDNVSYQWQYSTNGGTTWLNSPIASSKTSELVIDVTEKKNGFMFRCIVSDGKESITSDTCKLIVSNLVITTQPSNQTVKAGGKAHFTIEATGDNVSYQWQYSTNGGTTWLNSPIASSKTSELVIDVTEKKNGFMFRCIVSDDKDNSVTSSAAKLIAFSNLTITKPSSLIIEAGKTATFKAVATGTGTLNYKWQKSANGKTWSNISGATKATYSFTTALTDNNTQYRCVVSDAYGQTVTSSAAKLTIQEPNAVIPVLTREISIAKDSTYQIEYKGKGIRYISNSKAVTVSNTGLVKVNDTVSTAYISVIDAYGHRVLYKVHVEEPYVALAFDDKEVSIKSDETIYLYTNKYANFMISDENKINILGNSEYYDYSNGYKYNRCAVTGFIPGQYQIIAYTEDGETDIATVNVTGTVKTLVSGQANTGTTENKNLDWYRYVNNTNVRQMVTFDAEQASDQTNIAYSLYLIYRPESGEPETYYNYQIGEARYFLEPGEEIYVRISRDGYEAAGNYNFTANITDSVTVDYTIGELKKDQLLSRNNYTEYVFTPDSSSEYEMNINPGRSVNWTIYDTATGEIVKNGQSGYNENNYVSMSLKANNTYKLVVSDYYYEEDNGKFKFIIEKLSDSVKTGTLNEEFSQGVAYGKTYYIRYDLGTSENPQLDVYEFVNNSGSELSWDILSADMETPYDDFSVRGMFINGDNRRMYVDKPTTIYVKISNESSSPVVAANFTLNEFERSVEELPDTVPTEQPDSIGTNEVKWYKLSAPESGEYRFKFTDDDYENDDDSYSLLVDYEVYTGEELNYESDLGSIDNPYSSAYKSFESVIGVEKGDDLWVRVTTWNDYSNPEARFNYKWSVDLVTPYTFGTLTLDTPYAVENTDNANYCLKFTAPETHVYYFWSESPEGDPWADLYKKANWSSVGTDNDSGYGNNFCVAYRMQAGETVYLHPHGVYYGNIIVSKTDRSRDYEPILFQ